MNTIKVAGAVLNQTPLDWAGNAANIEQAIGAAREAGARLVCLPEMCTCGYGCEDAFSSPDVRRRSRKMVERVLPLTKGMVVSLGLPVLHRNALFNCAAVLADGELVGLVAKRHLAGEGLHYEPRWFKPWPAGLRGEADFDGLKVPIGDLWFRFESAKREVGGLSVGFEICEDAWVASRPGAGLARRGVDVIMNPSASHFAFGKMKTRRGFVVEGSRAFGATYVYSNLLGNEAGRAIYDGGVIIASCGDLLAQGSRLGFEAAGIATAVVDLDRQRTMQARTASFEPELRDDECCVRVEWKGPMWSEGAGVLTVGSAEVGTDLSKEEEFGRAVGLGLFDYLRKSRARGFVVSLSGGADSAAMSALARLMVDLGVRSLGVEGFKAKLGHIGLKGADAAGLTRELLTTVYQASANSSEGSRVAAVDVAAALGARHVEFDIEPMVRGYVGLAEAAAGRKLDWVKDDLALQNIQARSRGPSVWMLANIEEKLLLATSNRSEAAVGYATMDGDTCGGLSPIAGIDKAFLLKWLRWMETTGVEGVGPMPGLAAVTSRTPSPELRPESMNQTSEGDLMPYEVLEAIEDAAISAKRSPAEVVEVVGGMFPAIPRDVLRGHVQKFFTLWCRNQWKRERYAPSFHVDDHNLDPKTWCRFPILSGGFAEELREMGR